MFITINGEKEEVQMKLNLSELILFKGLRAENVVIEHNLRIVPKEEWQNTYLQGDDKVEIVSFIGGG